MEIILPVDAPMLRCSNIPLHLEKNESTLALMSNSSFRSIFPSPQLLMLKVWSTVSGKSWLLLKLDLTPLKFLGFTLAEAVDWSKRQIETKFKFDLRNISNRVFNLQWSCSAPVIDRRFATNEVIYLSARIKPWRRLLKTWKWFKFFSCFFFYGSDQEQLITPKIIEDQPCLLCFFSRESFLNFSTSVCKWILLRVTWISLIPQLIDEQVVNKEAP